jgi:hypothetical protein
MDHIVRSGCLIPALPLLKSQLRKAATKSTKAAKPTTAAKSGLGSSPSRPGEMAMAALVDFCEKVNKSAKKKTCVNLLNAADGYVGEVARVGAAVLAKCKVPVHVRYRAKGQFASGRGFETIMPTAAAAEAAVRKQKPKCTLKEIAEVYSGDGGESPLLCDDFVHPDCDYDGFSGDQQLYFRVAEKSLWISSGRPKKALKCLAEQLGVAPKALVPVTWVCIDY